MIEHIPWCGSDYQAGIDGQRIAIMGYSHHVEEDDSNEVTRQVVQSVIDGEKSGADQYAFFCRIRDYFGFTSHREFWNRVLFFNYLADRVGKDEDRFKSGTDEQIKCATTRFDRIICKWRPAKVLVFTKKGWMQMPETREEKAGCRQNELGPAFHGFERGSYDADGHIVMAFGLRHPQGARKEVMRRAVQYILALPPVES
jgi:hypothetical protein